MTENNAQAAKPLNDLLVGLRTDQLRMVANQLTFWAQEFKATAQSLRDLGIADEAIIELYVELGATVGVGQWLESNEQAAEKKKLEKLRFVS